MVYVSEFSRLVELERQAEIRRHEEEIERLSPVRRKELGRCVFPVSGKAAAKVFHFTVVRFISVEKIHTRMKEGDLVLVNRVDEDLGEITGTIAVVKPQFIEVWFETVPPKSVYRGNIRLDLYANDLPYRRMLENLQLFWIGNHPLKGVVLGERDVYGQKEVHFEPLNEDLNASQISAVSKALGTRDVFMIHGPPGTGKTTTLVELVLQAVQRSKSLLCTAESNTAVDNMLERVVDYEGFSVVRLGHPARVKPNLRSYGIFEKLVNHPSYPALKQRLDFIETLRQDRDKFEKPGLSNRRGMSDKEILQKAAAQKGARGVKTKTMASMARWIFNQQKIQGLTELVKEQEKQLIQMIINEADIVFCTNSTAGSDWLEKSYFDLTVIDEGSQQIEPSTLIPLLKGRRIVIAGDHQQLPPTVIHAEAQRLKKSLFERFINNFPQNSVMLDTQYRMNKKIVQYSAGVFYKQKLKTHSSNRNRSLPQSVQGHHLLNGKDPVVFLDTVSGKDPLEALCNKHKSYYNAYEIDQVEALVMICLRQGILPNQIGVIAPYQGQVQRLARRLDLTDVEVNTVDGFQGREKEVIILSLVRANETGKIGFLKDYRRLNVSITRARSKLLVIGHSLTLKQDNFYADWLKTMAFLKI